MSKVALAVLFGICSSAQVYSQQPLFVPGSAIAVGKGLGRIFLADIGASPAPKVPLLVVQAPPEASVTSVAVSPDGALVATDSFDGRVRIHDLRTGALLRAIDTGGGRGVAFAPDGRSLACAGYHMDKLVGVYDVRTGKLVRKLAGHTQLETYAIAFSPDGKLLASAGTDKQILVWELSTGTLLRRLADQPLPVTALAFSPDCARLASGGGGKTIRLWDASSGRLVRTLAGHRDWVSAVAFSPDGKTIVSGSCDWAFHRGRDTSRFGWPDPGCVSEWKAWNASTGELKRTVNEPGRLLSLAVSPDGLSLACAIAKDVRLYDLRDESPGRVVTSHDFDVTSVAFTRDGGAAISSSHDQTVKRTSLATGKVQWHVPGHFEQVNSVAVSRDGALLVTGSSDQRFAVRVLKASAKALGPGAVRLWDAQTGRLLRRLGDPGEQVMAVAVSPDGRHVASGGVNQGGLGVVHLWDAATGVPVWSQDDHAAEVLAVSFSPDGSSIASASATGSSSCVVPERAWSCARWPVTKGVRPRSPSPPTARSSSAAKALGGFRIWKTGTGRLLHTCKPAGSKAGTVTTDRSITTVVLTPDSSTALAGTASIGNTYGEPVRFWDVRTGKLKNSSKVGGGRPIALSPDGLILAGGGKSVSLRDVQTGKELRRLVGHLKKVQAIAFSADGRLIVSGGSYGTTNVWEVTTGRLLVTLFAFPANRDGTVTDDWLAYHPEGFYDGSPGVERYLAWRVGEDLLTPDSLGPQLHRPDRLVSALKLDPLKLVSP